jgi:hypothetical protein
MYDHSTRNDGQNGSYEYCGTNNFDEVDYLYRTGMMYNRLDTTPVQVVRIDSW